MKFTDCCTLCLYGFIHQKLEVKAVSMCFVFFFLFLYYQPYCLENSIQSKCHVHLGPPPPPVFWWGPCCSSFWFYLLCFLFCLSSLFCVQYDCLFLMALSVLSNSYLKIVNQNTIYVL